MSLLTTLVAVTTAPAVGLWFPRFSAISIGQSRDVIPPRLLTTAFHFLGVTIPGALLAVLLLEPQLARTLIAGLIGFFPAALLQLATGGGAESSRTWGRGFTASERLSSPSGSTRSDSPLAASSSSVQLSSLFWRTGSQYDGLIATHHRCDWNLSDLL
ncbi:hypothetical protein VB779_21325 [Haloarculaceae archaeon H-GB11]|nr:hypothetical protein [Haloarculaceae archaeon H-GB11]